MHSMVGAFSTSVQRVAPSISDCARTTRIELPAKIIIIINGERVSILLMDITRVRMSFDMINGEQQLSKYYKLTPHTRVQRTYMSRTGSECQQCQTCFHRNLTLMLTSNTNKCIRRYPAFAHASIHAFMQRAHIQTGINFDTRQCIRNERVHFEPSHSIAMHLGVNFVINVLCNLLKPLKCQCQCNLFMSFDITFSC